ncbi:hypothetical protein FPV67DRAFT_1777459 [Lyophyllum atratum]|nr:hypothetical protein FPV67DRAFT_1777459 [Lyophyllum atratum]
MSAYRAPSPIFDVPEFPALRRVKPLPKRRRTEPNASSDLGLGLGMLSLHHTDTNLDDAGGIRTHAGSDISKINETIRAANNVLAGLGQDGTAEELLGHAESMQSYYMPFLGSGDPASNTYSGGGGRAEEDAEDGDAEGEGDGEGDYIDHLTQPGNTKKRKVPTTAVTSRFPYQEPPHHHLPSPSPSTDSPPTHGHEVAEVYQPPPPRKRERERGKLGQAMLAGLKHKEMLRTRKRQLAAVLGALSHGDGMALDQALSASCVGGGGEGGRVRLSRRRVVRRQRAVRRLPRHPDQAPFPVVEFTMVCGSKSECVVSLFFTFWVYYFWDSTYFPSPDWVLFYFYVLSILPFVHVVNPFPAADRLIATKEEVAMLRKRFEAELARQASKAAKTGTTTHPSSRSMLAAASPSSTTASSGGAPVPGGTMEKGKGAKGGNGKKKKRSALANASNPHHLRNYVPGRLPHSGSAAAQAQQNANANAVGPLALRFLSAEIPPRRRKKSGPGPAQGTLTNPGEEWICAFCEYALFYGEEEGGYRRGVRNRKKILRRRRRARERAAAAASGNSTLRGPERGGGGQEEYEEGGYEPSVHGEEVVGTAGKRGRGRGDGRERGGGAVDGYG